MKEFSSILTTDSSAFRVRVCLFFKVEDWIIFTDWIIVIVCFPTYGKTFYQIL